MSSNDRKSLTKSDAGDLSRSTSRLKAKTGKGRHYVSNDTADLLDRLNDAFDYRLTPRCLLHIGAHEGQEVALYVERGIAAFHIEANPLPYRRLLNTCADHRDQVPLLACLDATSGEAVTLNISSNETSSSLLPLGRHAVAYSEVTYGEQIACTSVSLDDLIEHRIAPQPVDFAVLDVQGAEHRVLAGASHLLASPDFWGMIVEVSLDPLYEGGATLHGLYDSCLRPAGFYLNHLDCNRFGWGNALFLRRWWPLEPGEVPPLQSRFAVAEPHGRDIAGEGRCSQSSLSVQSRTPDEAQNAVAGRKTGEAAFQTAVEKNPWWQVDFGTVRRFDEVRCSSAFSTRSDRLRNLVIEISADGRDWQEFGRAEGPFGGLDGAPLQLVRPDSKARFVRLRLRGRGALAMDAVEIFDWQAG